MGAHEQVVSLVPKQWAAGFSAYPLDGNGAPYDVNGGAPLGWSWIYDVASNSWSQNAHQFGVPDPPQPVADFTTMRVDTTQLLTFTPHDSGFYDQFDRMAWYQMGAFLRFGLSAADPEIPPSGASLLTFAYDGQLPSGAWPPSLWLDREEPVNGKSFFFHLVPPEWWAQGDGTTGVFNPYQTDWGKALGPNTPTEAFYSPPEFWVQVDAPGPPVNPQVLSYPVGTLRRRWTTTDSYYVEASLDVDHGPAPLAVNLSAFLGMH